MCPGTRSTCPGHALILSPDRGVWLWTPVLISYVYTVSKCDFQLLCFAEHLVCILEVDFQARALNLGWLNHFWGCLTYLKFFQIHTSYIGTVLHWCLEWTNPLKLCNIGYLSKMHLNPNLVKYYLFITRFSATELFWNFAQSRTTGIDVMDKWDFFLRFEFKMGFGWISFIAFLAFLKSIFQLEPSNLVC